MTDEQSGAGDYRSYADRVVISVRIADAPLDERVDEVIEIETAGAAWHRDWLVAEVEAIPNVKNREGFPAPYAIDVQEKRHEWGASAAAIAITVFIASAVGSGVVGNGAYDALKVAARNMAVKLREAGNGGADPLGEAEALGRSQALILARYGEPAEDLKLVSVEVVPPFSASVVYCGSRGWIYDCDLSVVDGLVTFTRVKRRRD
ncbi:hypothetical protein ACIA5G_46965 [Amycolatopsis sp. NPDC051758]|uniref:hypothetical protein n=1 Tax=Amycolatopsis sp. NPDC051758 TaxID=3363935 RepID=UPI00379AD9E8